MILDEEQQKTRSDAILFERAKLKEVSTSWMYRKYFPS